MKDSQPGKRPTRNQEGERRKANKKKWQRT